MQNLGCVLHEDFAEKRDYLYPTYYTINDEANTGTCTERMTEKERERERERK